MSSLDDVRARSEAHDATRWALYRAIRAAHAEGHSLRAIAAEALLSHEQVRRVVNNAPQEGAKRSP